jgi:hypothetical protein
MCLRSLVKHSWSDRRVSRSKRSPVGAAITAPSAISGELISDFAMPILKSGINSELKRATEGRTKEANADDDRL